MFINDNNHLIDIQSKINDKHVAIAHVGLLHGFFCTSHLFLYKDYTILFH